MSSDKKDSLCHLIDINNLPSLKIIEPDGNLIKKDQILELKSIFSRKSQYTKESIYIILNAEKMNKESANTLLKFLEEPNDNIIGFFITNNKDNVLLTIQSRCQNIDCFYKDSNYEKYNISENEYNELLKIIYNYLYSIEIEKKELILYNKKYLNNFEKNEIIILFKIILDIYEKALYNNLDIKFEFLKSFSVENIKKKIYILVEFLRMINYNVNLDLLLDNFIIEMDGVNNESI